MPEAVKKASQPNRHHIYEEYANEKSILASYLEELFLDCSEWKYQHVIKQKEKIKFASIAII